MKVVLTNTMTKIGKIFLIGACLLSGLLVLRPALLEAATQQYLPLPAGQQVFPYYCVSDQPALGDGTDIQQIRPLGAGSVANGGNLISLLAGFPQFAGNVDVYMGIYAPSISPDVYLLDSSGALAPYTQLVPWMLNVPLVWQPIFGDISTAAVTPGVYYLYLGVTPAGDTAADNFYIWETSFLVTPPYFSISNSCVNFGQASAGTIQQVTITNPGDAAQDMLTIDGIASSTGDYQIIDDTCSGHAPFAAGEGCNFNIVFAPAAAGQVSEGNILIAVSRVASSGGPSSAGLPDSFQLPIMVTGLQQACSQPPQINPSAKQFASSGGQDSITVTAGAGCNWTAQSDAAWITVSSGGSGTGNGLVSYSVAANAGTSLRTGHIAIGSQTFTVTQDGAGSTCQPSVGAAQPATFGASGGSGSINVTAPTGCTWTADVSLFYSTWLSITSGRQYTGTQTVRFSVAAGTTAKSGGLTVAGKTVAVSRTSSGSSCFYSIAANGATTFGTSGGNGSFTVTAGSGCPWTIKSTKSWPTSFSPASGSGSGTVSYTVPAASVSDTATIYINESQGTQLVVTQSNSAPPACSYSVSAVPLSFSSQGGPGTFTVTASGTGCAGWGLSSDSSWLTFTSGSTGTGSGSAMFSVSANTSTSQRTGVITLDATHKVTITQSGAQTPACTYSISSTDSQPIAYSTGTGDGTFTGTIAVTAGTGCTWSAASSASWITITAGSTGTGNGTVTYTVPANTGGARGGTISVADKTYIVVQAAALSTSAPPCVAYIAPQTSQSFGSVGGSGTFQFVTTGCDQKTWSVTPSATWITITSGGSGTGDGPSTASYSVSANTQTASRTGSITVGDSSIPQPFGVSQSGASQIVYTQFVLNSSNNFYSNPAAPAATVAQFFSFTIPAGGCPGTQMAQIWLAGLVPYAGNNNMLVTDTDFGTKDYALTVYDALYQSGAMANQGASYVAYPSGSSSHYWYYFTTSGESENIYVKNPVPNKTYYLAVVNDDPVYTQWRLTINCY